MKKAFKINSKWSTESMHFKTCSNRERVLSSRAAYKLVKERNRIKAQWSVVGGQPESNGGMKELERNEFGFSVFGDTNRQMCSVGRRTLTQNSLCALLQARDWYVKKLRKRGLEGAQA